MAKYKKGNGKRKIKETDVKDDEDVVAEADAMDDGENLIDVLAAIDEIPQADHPSGEAPESGEPDVVDEDADEPDEEDADGDDEYEDDEDDEDDGHEDDDVDPLDEADESGHEDAVEDEEHDDTEPMDESSLLDSEDDEAIVNETDAETEDESPIEESIASAFGPGFTPEVAKRVKAIFEAAVRQRMLAAVPKLRERANAAIKKAITEERATIAEHKKMLADKADKYMTFAVRRWVNENRAAIETNVRAEIAESFMGKLRTLFVEHYIDVPENRRDVVEELSSNVRKLEKQLAESIEENSKLRGVMMAEARRQIIAKAANGMTKTDAARLHKLCEGVTATSTAEFTEAVAAVKAAYFTESTAKPIAHKSADPLAGILSESAHPANTQPIDPYVKSILDRIA